MGCYRACRGLGLWAVNRACRDVGLWAAVGLVDTCEFERL